MNVKINKNGVLNTGAIVETTGQNVRIHKDKNTLCNNDSTLTSHSAYVRDNAISAEQFYEI